MFIIEDNLIDMDMLQVSGDEANRLYNELKARAIRIHRKKIGESKLKKVLNEEDLKPDDDFELVGDKDNRSSMPRDDSQFKASQEKKILEILTRSNTTDRLDFCNSLQNFIEANLEHRNFDALMPGLTLLSKDTPEVKKSLLNQLRPLTQLFTEKFGQAGYQEITKTVFPILEKLMYDNDEQVRDKSVVVVGEMRKVVEEPEKERIMKLTMDLAHDESSDKLRESAVKLINELAPDMGQEICEFFIVQEISSLGHDNAALVR